jgi:hypothetical protein
MTLTLRAATEGTDGSTNEARLPDIRYRWTAEAPDFRPFSRAP